MIVERKIFPKEGTPQHVVYTLLDHLFSPSELSKMMGFQNISIRNHFYGNRFSNGAKSSNLCLLLFEIEGKISDELYKELAEGLMPFISKPKKSDFAYILNYILNYKKDTVKEEVITMLLDLIKRT